VRLTDDEVAELYRLYAPMVYARARRLVGDEADDVVHDVFLRLLRGGVDPDERLGWLLRATTNAALDRLRHRARRDEAWRDEARASLGDAEVTIERLVEAQDVCRRLLGRFNEKTASVAAMILVDGMSQEQVAAVLGVTRTAIAKRLQSFLAQARELLGVSVPPARTSSK
jgi:RNA polymerase sigma-70 factor, ECF subfamily